MEKMIPATGIIINKITKLNQVKNGISKQAINENSTFAIALSELILFYPIELGLGMHPDVRNVVVNFIFSSTSIEERYFFLRQAKVPVRH